MNEKRRARVLDVGQCGMDHTSIRWMITQQFDADVDYAARVDEALQAMSQTRYDLVLVNRRIDADGSDGLELVRAAHADKRFKHVPLMLVSNYPQAQSAAVSIGARPGFGKAELRAASTRTRLAEFLPAREA